MTTHRGMPVVLTLAACVFAVAGCGRGDSSQERPIPAAPGPAKTPAPAAGQSESRDFTPAGLASRIAQFVGREVAKSRARFADAGLMAQESLTLSIRCAAAKDGSAKEALLTRVREAVAAAVGGVDGVTLGGGSKTNTAQGDGAVLLLDVASDLRAPVDKFHILAELDFGVGDRKICHRDHVRLGLITIVSPKGVEGGYFVRAVRPGFASEFKVDKGYFTLPIGRYVSLQVRSESDSNLVFSPPGNEVLLSNHWQFSAASAQPVVVEVPVSPPAVVVPSSVVQSPPAAVPTGQPSVSILAPRGQAGRHVTVSGIATNLQGATIRLVVTPTGDIDYIQDGKAYVTGPNFRWKIHRVVIGRASRADVGKTFALRAEGVRNGSVVASSPPVMVTRR